MTHITWKWYDNWAILILTETERHTYTSELNVITCYSYYNKIRDTCVLEEIAVRPAHCVGE